jgi:hypothetical protein
MMLHGSVTTQLALEVKFSEPRLLVVLGGSYAGSCIAPVQHLWSSELSPSQQEAPQEPRESPEIAETEETRFPPPHRPPQGLERALRRPGSRGGSGGSGDEIALADRRIGK